MHPNLELWSLPSGATLAPYLCEHFGLILKATALTQKKKKKGNDDRTARIGRNIYVLSRRSIAQKSRVWFSCVYERFDDRALWA